MAFNGMAARLNFHNSTDTETAHSSVFSTVFENWNTSRNQKTLAQPRSYSDTHKHKHTPTLHTYTQQHTGAYTLLSGPPGAEIPRLLN